MKRLLIKIIQNNQFKKCTCSRQRRYTSFTTGIKIGFICNIHEPDVNEAASLLMKAAKNKKITYTGLVMSLDEVEGDVSQYLSESRVSIIHQGDVNWYGMPRDPRIDAFIAEPFDILFDLTSSQRLFTIDYVIKASIASFKVGTSYKMQDIYDLIIKQNDKDYYSLPQTIEQLLKYLSSINNQ